MAGQGVPARAQRPQPFGDGLLGPVKPGKEHATLPVHGVSHQFAFPQLQRERRLDQPRLHLDQLGGERHQIGGGQAAVPVVHGFSEREADPGPDADRGCLLDAEPLGHAVRGQEADAADVAGEPVGVLRDALHGLGAVGLVDAHGPRGADPVRVQEQHDLADHLLLGPAGDDARGALGPDAGYLAQPLGLLLDQLENVLAKRPDELLGIHWADAADHAGPEILLDAFQRRGRGRFQERRLELEAVRTVRDPGATHLHPLARGDRGGVAHPRSQGRAGRAP